MTKTRILIADDDEMIVDALSYQLEREGYEVLVALDGIQALELARAQHPSLILLDVMMPRMQGWEVCREIRRESTVPILMLTARGEEIDKVLGLELGADDYMVKPFGFRELLARIHAQLRRASYSPSNEPLPVESVPNNETICYQIGSNLIDLERYTIRHKGEVVHLSSREFEILRVMIQADGTVIKRGDLLDKVWGEDWIGDPRTLDVHIRWLREKLEDDSSDPKIIVTVRNVGYRMVAPQKVKV
ncbi:MAG: response regulator transcription factor [Caldilineaceae bacterium]